MNLTFVFWLTFVQTLNGWTFAFKDYYELNITKTVDSPNLLKMSKVIDPYCMLITLDSLFILLVHVDYFDRYKKTKILQMQSSGDEFFLPDNEVEESNPYDRVLFLFSGYILARTASRYGRFLS
jgi:PhoPQ-activated pathogenicity-related protein